MSQETLNVLDTLELDIDTEKPSDEEIAKKFGFEDDYFNGTVSWWQKTKPRIWSMFDEPYSSLAAKVEIGDVSSSLSSSFFRLLVLSLYFSSASQSSLSA